MAIKYEPMLLHDIGLYIGIKVNEYTKLRNRFTYI